MKKREIKNTLKRLDELPLPDKTKILSSCRSAEEFSESPAMRRRGGGLKPLIAVCAAFLVMVMGISVYAVAAEAYEYNKAVTFFKDNALPTEGLSRSEIKNVYQDITAGSFTYEKTAEVIVKSISGSSVEGYEIFQDEPTPEDIEDLWNYKNYRNGYLMNNPDGGENDVSYDFRCEYKMNETKGYEGFDKSVVEKYVGGELVWSAEFTEFELEYGGYAETDGGVVVYGRSPMRSSGERSHSWLAMIGNDGTVLWKVRADNGFNDEYIVAALPGENNIAIFSRGDLNCFCFSEYDMNGNLVYFYKNEGVSSGWAGKVARLGDGYIAQSGYLDSRIVKIDAEGVITDSFTYESDDCYYRITDMIEYGGKIYLSAYAFPVIQKEDERTGYFYALPPATDYILDNLDNYDQEALNEEITSYFRGFYTAVLLVCAPDSCVPGEFYTVKGSLGGSLAVSDDGNLLWDVESLTNIYFSPMTNSFTFGGIGYIYRYTFDETGAIQSRQKTGETAGFRR